jgi:hypothetical protein
MASTFASRIRSLKVRRMPLGVKDLFRPMSCPTVAVLDTDDPFGACGRRR